MNEIKQHRRVCAYVDLDAIVWNLTKIHENIDPGTKVVAVIKADGYGHGAVPIAKKTEHLDYLWGFAVATAEEAFTLRENNIKKPVLVLGYTFEEHYEQMCRQNIAAVVFQLSTAKKMSEIAVSQNRVMEIHLAVDTGMTRIGYRDNEDSVKECVEISRLPGVNIEGLFTHFARADEFNSQPALSQLKRYEAFASMLKRERVVPMICHCSNSAGIMNLRKANLDMVRAGIILYGLFPSDEVYKDKITLRPALELKTHITYVKDVEPETPVSYGGTFVTTQKMRVATIPVGYADGYPRSLSNKGYVLLHGQKAPIIGRVCMDQFMIDVTHIPEARQEDEVTLIGRSKDCCITIEELGALSGRFNYEFACDLGKRIPRVYLGMTGE